MSNGMFALHYIQHSLLSCSRHVSWSLPLSAERELTRLLAYDDCLKGQDHGDSPDERNGSLHLYTLSGDTLNAPGNIGISCLPKSGGLSFRKWKPSELRSPPDDQRPG